MKVYLVRHGETEGNVGNFYQTEETPLTPHGIEQAKKIAKRLRGKGIDLIYSSTHLRAKKTSEILASVIKAPIEPWDRLMEIRRPKEIRGKHKDDPGVSEIERQMIENFGEKNKRISDEENFLDVTVRARTVLAHFVEKHKDQDIVCVSHGTFIKVITSIVLLQDALTPKIFDYIRHHLWSENTGLTVIEYREDKGYRLLTWNDTSHL